MKLYVVSDAGTEFQLLTRFFEALLPAFEDKADEIRVEPAYPGLTLTYCGKSIVLPLADSPRNYPMVAFPRILVLAGMSIGLEGAEQTGILTARYNQRLIQIHVTSRRDGDKWYLVFRPNTSLEPTATAPSVSTNR